MKKASIIISIVAIVPNVACGVFWIDEISRNKTNPEFGITIWTLFTLILTVNGSKLPLEYARERFMIF